MGYKIIVIIIITINHLGWGGGWGGGIEKETERCLVNCMDSIRVMGKGI